MSMVLRTNNMIKAIGVIGFLSLVMAVTYSMGSTDASSAMLSVQGISDSFALDLATNLKISERTAYAAIGVILVTSDILTALSLLAAVLGGVGLITAGMVQTAKALAKKKGKEYAAKW
ncbi:uberolysin/carnocyclin family circular bacteriocin [Metabacillus halosaccharovorans]|uniref:Uberolysin/carnocyclin family circular bacteriocin n=1 Tax=Metabacillus halosaccharovorans TaxID=930124 RepID=A0ABT3DGL3_9BACI|nr:uberolysin/carnocyclin family circular bacteriocin [Metabacillus halosaccharovorans]MCV9886188.1 uberolysin/carnocyclin family circular bacteriocin [Metabacillus halosaccharovorans]